jgi:hypothetical protein
MRSLWARALWVYGATRVEGGGKQVIYKEGRRLGIQEKGIVAAKAQKRREMEIDK